MTNKKARNLLNRKTRDGDFIYDLNVWEVPVSKHFPHGISYRLWFGTHSETLVLYDIHHGKPYHKHLREIEYIYDFKDLDTLIADFRKDTEEFK